MQYKQRSYVRLSAVIFLAAFIAVLSTPSRTQTSEKTKSLIADLPMLFRGPTPAIEVMVNGQGPFLFAIDTGAQGMARVDSTLVERLGLQKLGSAQGGDGSGQNLRTMDVVQLGSISFGGIHLQDVRAPTRNYNTTSSLPHIDGILGFNLFSDYLLTLDYVGKRVRVERGELRPDSGAILGFESPRGIPVVELQVGGHKIKAHIDSGNTIAGFVLPTSLVEKLTLLSPARVIGRARTVSSDIEIKEARLKEPISLGPFRFPEPTIVFPSISNDANIGSTLLREFTLTFDQKNQRVLLERHELPKAAEPQAADSAELPEYSGRFGERSIFLEGGALFIQRQGGPKLRLVTVSKDVFSLAEIPAVQIRFVRDQNGKIIELRVLNREGVWETSKRDQL